MDKNTVHSNVLQLKNRLVPKLLWLDTEEGFPSSMQHPVVIIGERQKCTVQIRDAQVLGCRYTVARWCSVTSVTEVSMQ